MGFYVKHDPQPGEVIQEKRWLTPGGRWSKKFMRSERFVTRARATVHLGKRIGKVVEL